ncbi:MAG TPA: ribonuclease P protein subunit [Nitrosopumilaceae archaeon]|nr:ribonuclease P protein subunit [Nitrosopumilaceae archaeon]
MITVDNITKHEFIGLKTQITDSTNSQIIGLNGTIINETKSMFGLKTEKGIKLIPKSTNSWTFKVNKQQITIDGASIQKRSFDRIGGKA